MKRKPLTAEWADRRGIPFEQHRLWLPARLDWWPTPPRRTEDKDDLQGEFHREFGRSCCWWCGATPAWSERGDAMVRLELHHLAAGSRGRTHERELFVMACATCHREHVGEQDLGRWLWLKWRNDRKWCDWCWLAVRHGYFLPDLITEERSP